MDPRYFKMENNLPVEVSAEEYAAWVKTDAAAEYLLENTVSRENFDYLVITRFDGKVDDEQELLRMYLFRTSFVVRYPAGAEEPQTQSYSWPNFKIATDMHKQIIGLLSAHTGATPAGLKIA